METQRGAPEYAQDWKKAVNEGVRIGIMIAVRSEIVEGRFQNPEEVESFRQRAYGLFDNTEARRIYGQRRATELRGLVDEGIAQGLNPDISIPDLDNN